MHLCQSVISTSTSYLDRSHDRIKYSHDVSLDLSREYACESISLRKLWRSRRPRAIRLRGEGLKGFIGVWNKERFKGRGLISVESCGKRNDGDGGKTEKVGARLKNS